jgi:hypothetical protein
VFFKFVNILRIAQKVLVVVLSIIAAVMHAMVSNTATGEAMANA